MDPSSTSSSSSFNLPAYPIASSSSNSTLSVQEPTTSTSSSKRKATSASADDVQQGDVVDDQIDGEISKKSKSDLKTETETLPTTIENLPPPNVLLPAQSIDEIMKKQQSKAFSFLSMLDPKSLQFPQLPNNQEMENVLLEVRKKALREEYGV